jgi:3-hydroxyacyl-CoA dehydrogenase
MKDNQDRRPGVPSNTKSSYREATIIGGGVIGISWTALFLAHGLGVTVADPLPDIADRVRARLREIAPTLTQLGLPVHDLTNDSGALKFDSDLARAVVANRLQAALFREAVYLVAQGVVAEQEVDAVVTSSIGMGWAVAGPFQTFHLGGGPGGLADFLAHLGPAMAALWSQLGAPSLDAPTVDLLTEQARHFDGTLIQLATRRDDAEIKLMRALDETPAVA